MSLTNVNSTVDVDLSNTIRKWVLALKGFWQLWGDNTTKDWTPLSVDNIEEYLITDQGPQG